MSFEFVDALTRPPVVGETYLVPCLVPEPDTVLPVIGPRHADPDLGINARVLHYHSDLRFMSDALLRLLVMRRVALAEGVDGALAVLNAPIEALAEFGVGNLVHWDEGGILSIVYRPLQCQREAPLSPIPLRWQETLEAAYAGQYLLPGGRCPHRGAPLLSLPLHGGRRVCPLHGLCFDERGRQCPKGRP